MTFFGAARLYPIVDPLGMPGRSHEQVATALLDAGVRLLQVRVKSASTQRFVAIARHVKAMADQAGVPLIINDRCDIAALVAAAGVHLGQADVPAAAARQFLGPAAIIGLSTHTVAQAEAAAREGIADYIGFGPIFATTSKEHADPVQGLEALAAVRRRVHVPVVAIGGITAANMDAVFAAGADAVALIGALVRAADIRHAARTILARLPR